MFLSKKTVTHTVNKNKKAEDKPKRVLGGIMFLIKVGMMINIKFLNMYLITQVLNKLKNLKYFHNSQSYHSMK